MVVFLSQSGTFGVEKPAYAGIIGLRMGGFGQTTGTTQKQLAQLFYFSCKLGGGTVFEKKMRIGGSMSMNAHVRKGNGWWGGETTLKNGELSMNYQTTKTTQ